jgi:hypothetical protein
VHTSLVVAVIVGGLAVATFRLPDRPEPWPPALNATERQPPAPGPLRGPAALFNPVRRRAHVSLWISQRD